MGKGPVLALLAIGYALSSVVLFAFFRPSSGLVYPWVANVVAVAFLLRMPSVPAVAATVTVFASCLATNLLYGHNFGPAFLYAAANASCVGAGTAMVRRRQPWNPEAPPSVTGYLETLILAGGVAPAMAAAGFAVFAEAAIGRSPKEAFLGWLSGDALGFSLLLPVLLFATRDGLRSILEIPNFLRIAALTAGIAATAAVAVAGTDFPFAFVIVPMLVAAACCRPFDLAIVCLLTGIALLALATAGMIPVRQAMTERANVFQISVAVVIVLPFLGGLLMDQMRRDQRRIFESEQRFRSAMQDSAIGMAIVGLDDRMIETNRAFADMLGYSTAELEGMSFMQITFEEDLQIGTETMRRAWSGEATTYQFEKRYARKDGSPVWALVAGSVIRDEETAKPLYLISQIEDIDARKKSEAAIIEAETRWNFALTSAGQGVWDLDLKRGRSHYSAMWKAILGYGEDELDTEPDLWLSLIHPDDRHAIDDADKAHVDGTTAFFEAEFRMRHKDGHWVWILDRGKALERDETGRAIRAIGTHTDITRLKETEARLALSAQMLAEEKERLRVTLQSIGDAVICTDASNLITFMNPTAEKLTRVSGVGALGSTLADVYAPVDEETGEVLASAEGKVGPRGTAEHNNRAVLLRADGSRCSIREVVSPILTEKGEPGGFVIVFQDFTDARTLQRELAHAAAHDALTGLANRSSFIPAMTALVDEARRGSAEHQLVYLDLDHFKSVNDTAGHAAGDALLKKVAETIRASIRHGDLVARLGGDEFAVVYRSCPAGEAGELANRLVAAVSALEFFWEGRSHSIGVSAGLASIDAASGEVAAIIARADEACYAAKALGRGRVSSAGESGRIPLDIAI